MTIPRPSAHLPIQLEIGDACRRTFQVVFSPIGLAITLVFIMQVATFSYRSPIEQGMVLVDEPVAKSPKITDEQTKNLEAEVTDSPALTNDLDQRRRSDISRTTSWQT